MTSEGEIMVRKTTWTIKSGTRSCRCDQCGEVIIPGDMVLSVIDPVECDVEYHYCRVECVEESATEYDQWEVLEATPRD